MYKSHKDEIQSAFLPSGFVPGSCWSGYPGVTGRTAGRSGGDLRPVRPASHMPRPRTASPGSLGAAPLSASTRYSTVRCTDWFDLCFCVSLTSGQLLRVLSRLPQGSAFKTIFSC